MNDAKEPHTAASAIAAFDATQLAFVALVKKGALSKIEAEEILRQAIKTIKTASTGDQAAELLAGILEDFPSLSPHLGNRATKNTCAAAGRSLVRHRGAHQADALRIVGSLNTAAEQR